MVVPILSGLKREAGVSPARSRHCNWRAISHTAEGGVTVPIYRAGKAGSMDAARSQETCLRLGLIHFAEGGMNRKINHAWPSGQVFLLPFWPRFGQQSYQNKSLSPGAGIGTAESESLFFLSLSRHGRLLGETHLILRENDQKIRKNY